MKGVSNLTESNETRLIPFKDVTCSLLMIANRYARYQVLQVFLDGICDAIYSTDYQIFGLALTASTSELNCVSSTCFKRSIIRTAVS